MCEHKLRQMKKSQLAAGFLFAGAILSLSGYINSAIALILGFVFTFFFENPYKKESSKAVKHLLKIAIIGLGFGMNFTETLKVGTEGFSLTFLTISVTLILGFAIGKLLKMDKKQVHLISSGTAICGGSAIAAVASAIKAQPLQISVSLGVVFLLNSVALLIFPSIGHHFNMSQEDFGRWSAIAIHDTSSVVGAAQIYGDKALDIATTVKLARTLWIIPISFLSAFMFKSEKKNISIPWFILFFVLAILINTYLNLPSEIGLTLKDISKRIMVLTLFLIGTSLSVKDIKAVGMKPIILGATLWVVISVLSFFLIV